MKSFFEALAIPMDKPQSYGAFHLIFFIVGLAVSILIAWLLRKTNEKQNKIVLGFVGAFLIIAEVLKQLFYYYIIGNETYQWWIFPFQLCSVPMYLCLISLFLPECKFRECLFEFMFSINMFGGFIAFLEPSGLNHPWLFLTLHAYIWHMLLIFLGLYLYFSKRVCNTKKGYLKAIATFIVLAGVAQIINITLNKPGLNMFYISPYVQSPLAVFSMFWEKLGWLPNMLLYLLAITIASAVVYYIFYSFRKSKNK
ncbi:MAG: YwaF family protein [Clostridia bacterium]|nr:YwaF family protein [Clostridia bacterium]